MKTIKLITVKELIQIEKALKASKTKETWWDRLIKACSASDIRHW